MEGKISASATTATTTAKPLSTENVDLLLDSVDAFLLDCDGLTFHLTVYSSSELGQHALSFLRISFPCSLGVIWHNNVLLDGVAATLHFLRLMGKRLFFVTNNSNRSRRQNYERFESHGISVSEEEIFSSSYAVAMYLAINNFPSDKRIYVIGPGGILEDLKLVGYNGFEGPDDDMSTEKPISGYSLEDHANVGAVVLGFLYLTMTTSTLCMRNNPECLFITTSDKAISSFLETQQLPDANAVTTTLGSSHSIKMKPILVGKPSTIIMDIIRQRCDISCSRMCMVGDTLPQDIAFGKKTGCKTLLVLSGRTTLSALCDPSNDIQPDYYSDSVGDIFRLSKQQLPSL
ncbi:hypothetical protein MLD38_003927 [Melastoma candidum]|uniref:Uncharacterized protein n=1 Tax=Melastoma candidum TaxID=119954 RepID=A0ACB9S5M7_9MYRT|nr:hypothetical protein MLD38_003927 [Melastoma candidum]